MEQITGETYQYSNYEFIEEPSYWPVAITSKNIILLPDLDDEYSRRHEKVHIFHNDDHDYSHNIGYWEGVAEMVANKANYAGNASTAMRNYPYMLAICDYDSPLEIRNTFWTQEDYALNTIVLTIIWYRDKIVTRDLTITNDVVEMYEHIKEQRCGN